MIAVEAIADPLLAALGRGRRRSARGRRSARRCERAMFADARPLRRHSSPRTPRRSPCAPVWRARRCSTRASSSSPKRGSAAGHPFSGEKLSPVLAFYRVARLRRRHRAGKGPAELSGSRTFRGPAHARRAARARAGTLAAGLPRHRQPGALLRHRRLVRQCAAVLAVDGLRNLGRATASQTT